MKSMYHCNNIVDFELGDVIVDDVDGVKRISFNELSHEDEVGLEAPFSLKDVK